MSGKQYTNMDPVDERQVREQYARDTHIDDKTWVMIGFIAFIPGLYVLRFLIFVLFGW